MNTIIYPIFPSAIDEGNFLSILIRKKAPLLAVAQTMMGKKGWQVIVCTNNQLISHYAEGLGLRIACMEKEADLNPGPLPAGALPATEYCERARILTGGVVLLDYRHLGVRHDEVEQAMTKAERDNSILVSILEPQDHPVQFDVPLERAFTETHIGPDTSFLDRLEGQLPTTTVASFPFFSTGNNAAYTQSSEKNPHISKRVPVWTYFANPQILKPWCPATMESGYGTMAQIQPGDLLLQRTSGFRKGTSPRFFLSTSTSKKPSC